MRRQSPFLSIVLIVAVIWAPGCNPQQPHYLFEDGDLSHYKGEATRIEYPDAQVDSLDEVTLDGMNRPMTLEHPESVEKWPLSLEEAVHIALANNKIMRKLTREVGAAQDFLTSSPDFVASTYGPALAEADPRYGPEAALSAFDAQLGASVFWQKTDRPQNVIPDSEATVFMPTVSMQDSGVFSVEVSKTNVTGGTTAVRHNVDYLWGNALSRVYPSDWNVNLEAEFRQPLLQGAGVQFNRIAGPGAIPGVNNGVVLARLNTDIELASFEAEVRNFVNDVERAYWGLYLAYRLLDTSKQARDSALKTWRQVYDLFQEGALGGDAASESQVREQYFLFENAAQARLSKLYAIENNLRYMMGISATDGRLIRPSDEVTTAKVDFPWTEVHYEAMARSVDLRQQRWKVKKRELELIAAKNYLLPKLDAVGQYRWLGWGDDLIATKRYPAPDQTAYQSLTGGQYQEWQIGLQLEIPIGFRKEMAGVRFAQLNLARDRSLLREQELEVSHQMAQAIRELEGSYKLIETGFSRVEAARHNVEVLTIKRQEGARLRKDDPLEIKVLLDAQRSLAVAEADFYQTLHDYVLSIAQVHFRKGSLLEYNGVYLAEGPWPAKAYFDATRRARARDAAIYMDYGYTRPKVMSRGQYEQHIGTSKGIAPEPTQAVPMGKSMEEVPAPPAEPIEAPQPPDNRSVSVPAAPGSRLAGNIARPAVQKEAITSDRGSRELGRGLRALAGASGTSTVQTGSVQPVSYQKPVSGTAGQGWTTKKSSSKSPSVQNKPVANPPVGHVDRPASGWKKSKR